MFFLHSLLFLAALLLGVQAQQGIESWQRWLMIIKPNVDAGVPYVGTISQDEIDKATVAFKRTWPELISNITSGRVFLDTHVLVSPRTLTSVSRTFQGMVAPEDIEREVSHFVSPSEWDGVFVYAGFNSNVEWGTSSAAGVGWCSVPVAKDLSRDGQPLAAWTHEFLHSLAWYFEDERLGPIAPKCDGSQEGRDGTHCATEHGYIEKSKGKKDWMGYYTDYLNGVVDGDKGLGSKAWKLGTRREAALKLKPGSLKPPGYIEVKGAAIALDRRAVTFEG